MNSSPEPRVFVDETPTIAFRAIPAADQSVGAPPTEPEWPAALGLLAAKLWSSLRSFWAQRTPADRVVLTVVAAIVLVLVGAGLGSSSRHSTSGTSSSPASWYDDLGPIWLKTSARTVYRGDVFDIPAPSDAGLSQFFRDTGATDASGGLANCADIRYGNTSFVEAKDFYTGFLHQDEAWAENYIRSAMIDLCPA